MGTATGVKLGMEGSENGKEMKHFLVKKGSQQTRTLHLRRGKRPSSEGRFARPEPHGNRIKDIQFLLLFPQIAPQEVGPWALPPILYLQDPGQVAPCPNPVTGRFPPLILLLPNSSFSTPTSVPNDFCLCFFPVPGWRG